MSEEIILFFYLLQHNKDKRIIVIFNIKIKGRRKDHFTLSTVRGRSDFQPTRGDEKSSLHFLTVVMSSISNNNNNNN